MASAPFSTAALAHSKSPAGASNSGRVRRVSNEAFSISGDAALLISELVIYHKDVAGQRIFLYPCTLRLCLLGGLRLTPWMRVLIIGTGYVGLPLAAELARQGYDVSG